MDFSPGTPPFEKIQLIWRPVLADVFQSLFLGGPCIGIRLLANFEIKPAREKLGPDTDVVGKKKEKKKKRKEKGEKRGKGKTLIPKLCESITVT